MRLTKLLVAAVLALTSLPLGATTTESQPNSEALPRLLTASHPLSEVDWHPTSQVVASDSQLVEIDAWDQGWYDSEGRHNPLITNYGVGEDDEGVVVHNWFVFDLPAEGTITAATLSAYLPDDGYMSPHPYEIWALYDVTTDIGVLVAGGAGLVDVFEDLGSGTNYGEVTVTSDTNQSWVDVPLNSDAIVALNAALGGPVAIGGALTSLDENHENIEILFAWSGPVAPKLFLEISAAEPDIEVEPVALSATQCPGEVTVQTLSICNVGGSTLDWILSDLPVPDFVPWLGVEPTSGSVAAGDCQEVTVTFDSTGMQPGTYRATLHVTSNDPDEPRILMPVTLAVESCQVSMHVSSIKLRALDLGDGRYEVTALVRVVDETGAQVAGALVDAEWTLPNGASRAQQSATNANGAALFRVRTRLTGSVQLCVTDVGKDGYTYDPGQNGETCDSVVLP